MMGGSKTGALLSAAPTTANRRAGAGTIGETAAIARRAAGGGDDAASAVSAPTEFARDLGENENSSTGTPPEKPEAPAHTDSTAGVPETVTLRRSKAGAGLLKDTVAGPDRTAAHMILAGRAYAYGMHIVHKDDDQKPGEVVAIVS